MTAESVRPLIRASESMANGLPMQRRESERRTQTGERRPRRILAPDNAGQHPADGVFSRSLRTDESEDTSLSGVWCKAVAEPLLKRVNAVLILSPD